MKKTKENVTKTAVILSVSVLISFFSLLAADFLIRHLGELLILAGEEQYGKIFFQLKSAKIFFHIPIVLFFAVFYFVINALIFLKKKPIATAIVTGFLFFVITALLNIWFARINGIRFYGVVMSLYSILSSGKVFF